MTSANHVAYTVAMPTRKIEMTKQIAFRMPPEMYRLVTAMRRVYGTDADVLRAGIMALWREFETLPGAGEPLPSSSASALDEDDE